MMGQVPGRILACVGLASAVLVAGLCSFLLAYGRGDLDPAFELTAVFPSSSQGVFTDGGTDVKMRGVGVGTVTAVELLADGRARLTMSIDDGVEVPATATASLEPLSVFGPKFVELDPGPAETSGPFLGDGDEITSATTGTELTDVLDGAGGLLAAVDPLDLITIFDATSTAMSGMGDAMGEGLDDGAVLLDIAHRRRDLLGSFLPDLRTVSTTIAGRSGRFLDRVQEYRAVAELVAGSGQNLDQLLDAMATLAARGASLLDDAAEDFDLTVRSVAAVVHGVYGERALVPVALDAVGGFFDMLGAGMRLPGPDGTKLTALKGFVTVDLCLVFGVCPLPEGGGGLIAAPVLAGSGDARGAAAADGAGLTALAGALIDPIGAGP